MIKDEIRQFIAHAVDDTHSLVSLRESGVEIRAHQFNFIISELRSRQLDSLADFAFGFTPSASVGRDKLLRYLKTLPELDRYFDDNRQNITSTGSIGFSVSTGRSLLEIVNRIIVSSFLHSVDTTTDILHDFLENEAFPSQLVFFLTGVRVEKEISLDSFSKLLSTEDTLALANMVSKHVTLSPSVIDFLRSAIVINTRIQSGTWSDENSVEPTPLLQGVAKIDIALLCEFLTLISQRQFHPVVQTQITDQVIVDTLPIDIHKPISSISVLNHLVPLLPLDSILPYLDTQELQVLVAHFLASSEDLQKHLHLPLARFHFAIQRLGILDKCVDLAIAFESLLTKSYESNPHRWFPKRAGWLYAETEDEKRWAESKMSKFYKYRSDIVHGKLVHEDNDLYLSSQSIFVVCLKNLLRRKTLPNWGFVDRSPTFCRPKIQNPDVILSAKHDSTSWTIGELKQIDQELSNHWKPTLEGLEGTHEGGELHEGDVDQLIAEFEAANVPYIIVSRKDLLTVHPFWNVALENDNEARLWHCEEDSRRHVNLWIESAAKRGLHIIRDSS